MLSTLKFYQQFENQFQERIREEKLKRKEIINDLIKSFEEADSNQ